MGYPMTWQRVCHRNGLAGVVLDVNANAHYSPFSSWEWKVNEPPHMDRLIINDVTRAEGLDLEGAASLYRDSMRQMQTWWNDQAVRARGRISQLAGDMRRFMIDVRDEQSICESIAHKTGADPDLVATIIAEIFAQ